MVAHVAHSFANKTKFQNRKEATISYGNEDVIKLRNFQSENLPEIRQIQICFKIFIYQRATNKYLSTSGLQTKVAHR